MEIFFPSYRDSTYVIDGGKPYARVQKMNLASQEALPEIFLVG